MKTKTKILTWIGISALVASIVFAFYFAVSWKRRDWVIVESSNGHTERQGLPEETNTVPEVSTREQEEKRIADLKNMIAMMKNKLAEQENLKKQGIREERDKEEKLQEWSLNREKRATGTEEFLKAELAEMEANLRQKEVSLGATDLVSPFLLVDRILESLKLGTIAFNAPSSMNLKDLAQIQLLLSMEKSIEELSDMVTAAGEKEATRIRVSNRMEAHLSGAGFQITAVTPEEQAITSKGNTEWKWEVKPVNPGLHLLHLTLTAIFNVDNTSMRRAIRTYDKTIEVEVTWDQRVSGFIGKNWQWLWATLLIPIAGFLWRMCKGRATNKREMQQKGDEGQQKGMQ